MRRLLALTSSATSGWPGTSSAPDEPVRGGHRALSRVIGAVADVLDCAADRDRGHPSWRVVPAATGGTYRALDAGTRRRMTLWPMTTPRRTSATTTPLESALLALRLVSTSSLWSPRSLQSMVVLPTRHPVDPPARTRGIRPGPTTQEYIALVRRRGRRPGRPHHPPASVRSPRAGTRRRLRGHNRRAQIGRPATWIRQLERSRP